MSDDLIALSDKTLVMIVGPSAIGKSFLMNEITKRSDSFGYVRSFTTRSPRPGEHSHYSFIDRPTAETLHRNGQTVTHFEHPTTHDIYGTTLESYPKEYSLLDTLSGSVADYRKLPFKRTITIALTATADDWRHWFTSRYPEPTPEANKRLKEAKLSIEWAINDAKLYWIVNSNDKLTEAASLTIATVFHPSTRRTTPDEPYAMMELIDKGMWQ